MEATSSASEYIKPKNLASPAKRLGGQMIDSIIATALFVFVGYIAELLKLQGNIAGVLALAAGGGYYLLSDAMPNGQSIGKRILSMAVIDENSHMNCNIFQSLMRNITTPFLSIFDWIFIFFGSRKRLGDMLASTIVINSK
ncbi:MAG: RDD family protein [Nitrososphaerales archaeon]